MTPADLVIRLRELKENPGTADPEVAHAEADEALLSYIDSTTIAGSFIRRSFDEISKWYA